VTGPTDSDQTGWDIGGLVGWNTDGVISNSFATGNVIVWGEVGGLVGFNWSGSQNPPFLAEITNCYSVGSVTGIDPVYTGGLAGRSRGAVNYSHWDTETSGTTIGIGYTDIPGGSSIGTTSKTTTEMKTQSTFTDSGWDFTNTWTIHPSRNNGYPYLQWQNCFNPTDGGTIAADQIICCNSTPDTFSSTAPPSGHLGTLEYQWQLTTVSSTASLGDWEDIGTNTDTYEPTGTVTQITWFRRLAKVTCATDWVESNVVEVSVDPLPTASAGGSATICENGSHQVSGANAEHGTINWIHNGEGSLSGETTLTPTYNPAAGDVGKTVTLTMTVTSDNKCAPATATAYYTINISSPGTLARVNTRATITPGGQVKFTATPMNGGDNPTYKWFKNRVEIVGETGNELISTCKSGDEHWVVMTSSIPCIVPAESNAMCTY